jgi:hypothetical protein
MRDGSSLQTAEYLLPQNGRLPQLGKGAAGDRFPRLNEECLVSLEQTTSAEFSKRCGSQVRRIRGLAVFLDR